MDSQSPLSPLQIKKKEVEVFETHLEVFFICLGKDTTLTLTGHLIGQILQKWPCQPWSCRKIRAEIRNSTVSIDT